MLHIKELIIKDIHHDLLLVNTLSLTLGKNDKIAIIGNEGSGKTTLLNVIANIELPHISVQGTIIRPPLIGYLKQNISLEYGDVTVQDFIGSNIVNHDYFTNVYALFGTVALSYELLKDRKIKTLSGGEKVKVGLISVLLNEPNILLLDEPSNDLDLESLLFLEKFILSATTPVLFVSHDQRFLQNVSNGIIHLQHISRKNVVQTYFARLNYAEYKERFISQYESDLMIARKQRSDYAKRMDKFRQIYSKVAHQQMITKHDYIGQLLKRKIKTMKSQERRFLKEKESFKEIPLKEEPMNLFFEREQKKLNQNKKLIEIMLKNFTLKNNDVISEINLTVKATEKIAIIGHNGSGKTTLLQYIYNYARTSGIKVGYLSQNYDEVLDIETDAVSFLLSAQKKYPLHRIRQILGAMGFKQHEMTCSIKKLSEGTKLKVLLFLLVSKDVDLLLLDEPTRNLSPMNQDELYNLFLSFQGAIIAVSHDREFIETVFDDVYTLNSDCLSKM